jgi:hypothetical protein
MRDAGVATKVLHVAARLTRGAHYLRLRLDQTWRWAVEIIAGLHRIRAAFTSQPGHARQRWRRRKSSDDA